MSSQLLQGKQDMEHVVPFCATPISQLLNVEQEEVHCATPIQLSQRLQVEQEMVHAVPFGSTPTLPLQPLQIEQEQVHADMFAQRRHCRCTPVGGARDRGN